MKFVVDQPVSPILASWLQAQAGHDAFHVRERGLSTADDDEIFGLAVQESRIIITSDLDFSRIVALSGRDAPGVILFRSGNVTDAEMLAMLQRVLRDFDADTIGHSIIVVEPTSTRAARLPVRPDLMGDPDHTGA